MRKRQPEPALAPPAWSLLGAAGVTWTLVVTGLLLTLHGPVTAGAASLDDAVHGWMVASEWAWLVRVAEVLAVTGSVWVTAPLRVLVGLLLAARRWWWHLGAWIGSIVISEVVVTQLKQGFGRGRPPLALEATRSDAFPSGHTAATAVTIATLVLLLPPGAARRRWASTGTILVVLMAASRVYLRVHWLSDVAMGAMIGVAAALTAVGLAAAGQRFRTQVPVAPA